MPYSMRESRMSHCVGGGGVSISTLGTSGNLVLEELGCFVLFKRVDDSSLGITDEQRAHVFGMKLHRHDRENAGPWIPLTPEIGNLEWGYVLSVQIISNDIT